MSKSFTIVLLFIITTSFVFGKTDSTSQRKMTAIKVKNESIKIDGLLNEDCWKTPPVNHFIQKTPDEGKGETEKTDVWVAYDADNIYVAAKLLDSKPDSIDESLARRDSWFDSDWFFVYLDPFNDKKTGYFFKVNAGGAFGDGLLFNDSWDTDSWDGIWEVKTSRDSTGWALEMKIPFSQLRFKQSDNMNWGINFKRIIKRNNESSYFVMVPKKESGFVSKFALLEGLTGIKPKQRFEVTPYLLQKAQYLRHDSGDPFYGSNQYKTSFGADIKLGIGSSLNLDATINPDFGQVEADPAVINLTAFESYFNEKRPFFIEGANTFEWGFGGSTSYSGFNFGIPELLYTRRIGRSPHGDISNYDYIDYPGETRILGAAKLTGKINDNTTIGAISAVTERTYATYDSSGIKTKTEVEPLTHYGVLRARTEFNEGGQALGFMLTSVNRDLPNNELKSDLAREAYVLGLDGWTFLDSDREYVVTGAFAGSYVAGTKDYLINLQEEPYRYYQRPGASYAALDSSRTSLKGTYGRIMLNKQKGNFYINAALGAISPGFENNDLGYQWMADRINGHFLVGYFWYDPDKIFREKSCMIAYAQSHDFDGNIISNFIWAKTSAQFLNYSGFSINGSYNFQTLSRSLTRGGPMAVQPAGYNFNIYAYTDSRKPADVSGNLSYNYDDGNSKDYYVGLVFAWKPNTLLRLSFEPNFEYYMNSAQWIDNFSDNLATNTYKTRYVFANMIQKTLDLGLHLNYTFNPKLTFQLYLQPYFSTGSFANYKELARPCSYNYNEYKNNGATTSYDKDNKEFHIDPDGKGPAESFEFDDPNFNFKSLKGTAVLRYEVRPGSVFYFVWSHNQTNDNNAGNFSLGRDFRNLLKSDGDNVIMVKFSYWFNI